MVICFFVDFQTFKQGDRNPFWGVIQCWFVKESVFLCFFFGAVKLKSKECLAQDVGVLNKDEILKTNNILKAKCHWFLTKGCFNTPLEHTPKKIFTNRL